MKKTRSRTKMCCIYNTINSWKVRRDKKRRVEREREEVVCIHCIIDLI
jgi:hypothetical protein